jgi:hypothetical protein
MGFRDDPSAIPKEGAASMQDAEIAIERRFIQTMLTHSRKRAAIFPQTLVAEGPGWIAETTSSLQRSLENTVEVKENQFSVASEELMERASRGLAEGNRVVLEIGRLTGADTFLLISGGNVAQGRLIEARVFWVDGTSVQDAVRLLISPGR